MKSLDSFNSFKNLEIADKKYGIYNISKLGNRIKTLPLGIRIILESMLRNEDGFTITRSDIEKLSHYNSKNMDDFEIPFKPARVILQDFTGVPAVVDLAALREAMKNLGGDPKQINPQIPVDLVIDHSIQVDVFNRPDAVQINTDIEYKRNMERYRFLRWGQNAFDNFNVTPPGNGIVHQVNLEHIARVIQKSGNGDFDILYPDTLVGTDSHTTMINGLGVLGWGVGGIEAEAVMLGQPVYLKAPQVIGVNLKGSLTNGATATDLVLTVTQFLREYGVVEKFVEFFGTGLKNLSLPDRATIANMAPEYGATIGLFPVDNETLKYMKLTGRTEQQIELVKRYCKTVGLFGNDLSEVEYTDIIELDISKIKGSIAGPKRPQDRMDLSSVKQNWQKTIRQNKADKGLESDSLEDSQSVKIEFADGSKETIKDGSVVIAAITSCTNTSNPSVMIAAGLLAKNAAEKGLRVKQYVKTSLAPGSKAVTAYLDKTGLSTYLDKLGFATVGYGCTSCIGNSGPLPTEVSKAINKNNLQTVSVLSGNRNFEGRINPHVKANYLASPPLVVAFALAGTIDIDFTKEPVGTDKNGNKVFLKDIWPVMDEINSCIEKSISPQMFKETYANMDFTSTTWNNINVNASELYEWNEESTYIQLPPFFTEMSKKVESIQPIKSARVLVMPGDSVTTDHISPAGAIPSDSAAARYLLDKGIQKENFNTFGSRRGNDRIMTRGTFGNIRLKNKLAGGKEGSFTRHIPTNKVGTIFDIAEKYKAEKTPCIVIAGKDYGMGSSRDWAAKGTSLLGIKAIIAKSFERIHRSNLVGMGVLPLQFKDEESAESLGLTGEEEYSIIVNDNLEPAQDVEVIATDNNGARKIFITKCRIDTLIEAEYYRHGGILHYVLRQLLKKH